MSILQEIQKWAPTLPAWQQDAVGRLFSKGELAAEDYDDLYALLKAQHGIADPKERLPKKLEASQVGGATGSGRLIQLTSIKNVKNVNALADNQCVTLRPDGITVIYGDNGSGKSGYSRALKKACRARDRKEEILPNAKLPKSKVGAAEAAFGILVDGTPAEVKWISGSAPPEQLADIAIFDSHCARAYLDEQDDFSYVPYGLDIIANLAKACNRLKAMLETELSHIQIDTTQFASLSSSGTRVGALLGALSEKTKVADIEALGTINPQEVERHAALDKVLKEQNPKEKSTQLRLRSGRIAKLASRCEEKHGKISQTESGKLRASVDSYKAAKKAAELAAKAFTESPGLLPGTGGEAWQALFEAARKFAAESHQGKEFPHLGEDAQCPLCQQTLGENFRRLIEFDIFVQHEAEKNARDKRAIAMDHYNGIKNLDMSIGIDAELRAEIVALSPGLADECDSFQANLISHRETIKAACGSDGNWDSVGSGPVSVVDPLRVLSDRLAAEAASLEVASDEKLRASIEAEFKELNARVQLKAMKQAVLATAKKIWFQSKLRQCQSSVRTNQISSKASELSETIVSKELADALNFEFNKLNAGELHVSLKSFSERGKTLHKLILVLPGAEKPTSVLSEGEQRAIAIASFLAEVNIGGGKGGIVFDDPVSSLDHRRREIVARRLAEEGAKRQVIIFTHDVYFLCILQQEAERLGTGLSALSLRRAPEGFGVADSDLPFEGAKTTRRIGMLRQMQVECASLDKALNEKGYRMKARDAYFHLRLAWERAVEEVLFKGVVIRFREGVETHKLAEVIVDDGDFFAVDAGMTKCSKYAHDKSANGGIAMPVPSELESDINALESWRKTIEGRSSEVRKRRNGARETKDSQSLGRDSISRPSTPAPPLNFSGGAG